MIEPSKELSEIIQKLDIPFIRSAIHYLDVATITAAAKTLEPAALDRLLQAMTPKEAESCKNKIAALGTISNLEITNAQKAILSLLNTFGQE
jgi:flagellar motor switch protein FliG